MSKSFVPVQFRRGGSGKNLASNRLEEDGIFKEFLKILAVDENGDPIPFDGSTAEVLRDRWIAFESLRAPGSQAATLVDLGISGAWEFSNIQDQSIIFDYKFLNDMKKSGPFKMFFGLSTPVTNVSLFSRWEFQYLYRDEGEDMTVVAQDTKTVDVNPIAQANGLVLVELPTLDTVADTDVCLKARLTRLATEDDLGGVAHLHGLCFTYVSDKRGTPIP